MSLRFLLLAACGTAALAASLTIPALVLDASQYGALAAGVQAFGVVAAPASVPPPWRAKPKTRGWSRGEQYPKPVMIKVFDMPQCELHRAWLGRRLPLPAGKLVRGGPGLPAARLLGAVDLALSDISCSWSSDGPHHRLAQADYPGRGCGGRATANGSPGLAVMES